MSASNEIEIIAEWLPIAAICKLFSISPATVYRLIKKQVIKHAKIGRARRINVASVRAYLDRL